MYKHVLHQFLRGAIVIAIAISSYLLFTLSFGYVYPFFVAFMLSMFIQPIVSFLENRIKIPRSLATGGVIVLLLFFLFLASYLIISEFIQGTTYLAKQIPAHYQSMVTVLEKFLTETILPVYHKIVSLFQTFDPSQQAAVEESIQKLMNHLATTGVNLLQDFFIYIPSMLALVPNSVTVGAFILLATFFITNDWNFLKEKLTKVIPVRLNAYMNDIVTNFKIAFSGYIKAQFFLVFISATIIIIGLSILHIDHALTITLLTAIADFLPLIGTGIIFIPWIIYLFMAAQYPMTIGLCLLYMIVIITRQVIEPKILSSSIGVNPLLGLFILFISIQVWGIIGIIAAPLLLICINVLSRSGILFAIWMFIKG